MSIKRIYVAGPWVDRERCKDIATTLEGFGYTITHPWWKYEGECPDNDPELRALHSTQEFLEQCAKDDVEAVRTADLVMVWNTYKSEGKAVEQGLAIAFEKPIICVTPGEKPSSNIFHYLRGNYSHVKTVDEAIKKINDYR